MLFVQTKRRNKGSYSLSLSKSAYFVVVDFCSIQCTVGDALFKGMLLSWGGSFVAKKGKRHGKLLFNALFFLRLLYSFFGPFGEREIKKTFENYESLNQIIKSSFLHLFWNWVKLYIADGFMSLIDFVD